MSNIRVFDKPMCCSTGVCGADVDPVLPQFAADLDWLKNQGHVVERFNLAQQPQAFIDDKAILALISSESTDCLPVILIDGQVVSQRVYPTRETFLELLSGKRAKLELPLAMPGGGCCGTSGCC